MKPNKISVREVLVFLTLTLETYPTRDQLIPVAKRIVRTYPALKDQSVGSGYVS